MSNAALASARKRRAPASILSAPISSTGSGFTPNAGRVNGTQLPGGAQNPGVGLTLPQVIALVDQRLVVLENHMKDNLKLRDEDAIMMKSDVNEVSVNEIPNNISEVLDEFDNRFETLAEEIANLKNIVLNLQSFTMDVNKTLLNERIRVLGEEVSETEVEVSASM